MYAKVSMSVTPGSDTLWSVHVGQRCWTSRLASSTRSWKRRSSRFGAGSMSGVPSGENRPVRLGGERRPGRLEGPGRERPARLVVAGDDVERKDQVARVVQPADLVADVDVERAGLHAREADDDIANLDPRLPTFQ